MIADGRIGMIGLLSMGLFTMVAAGAQPAAAARDLAEPLAAIRDRHRLPALGALVVKDGRVVARGAAGIRARGSDVPVGNDDLWHIGSCTKAMTATLCGVLVEEGKLSWDATIGAVFPELKEKIRPEYHGVTLAQLLHHRSGLPEDRAPGSAFFQIARLEGPMVERRARLVEIALSQPPAAAPGEKMIYSNLGYAIAGAMCERAAGRAWEDLMRERVFDPLGMESAGFGAPGRSGEPDQPRGHRPALGTLTPVEPGPGADNPAVIGPAGTVHGSLADWAKFVSLHLRGGRGEEGLLLEPETLARLHEDVYGQGYAMGWGLADRPWAGGIALTHAGSNTMWFAVVWAAPERDFAVLVATNAATESAPRACDEVAGAMVREFLRGE